MNTEEKYYVPDREDFKEGFEYEKLYNTYSPPDFKLTSSNWLKETFDDFTSEENYLFNRQLMDNNIRVPFLTKEDIEKEGWVYNGKSIDLWFYKEGEFERTSYTVYKVTLHYNLEDKWLLIYLKDNGEDVLIFQGKCRCINDFKTVCKLLNI
jgi:hypothetical protein